MTFTWFSRRIVAPALALSAFTGLFGVSYAQSPQADREHPTRLVAGEVLIQFREGTTESQQQEALAKVGALPKERIRHTIPPAQGGAPGVGNGRLELATLRAGQAVADAVSALQAHPAVAFAEPNWIYTHQAVSNDPYYTKSYLWGTYSSDSPSAIGTTGTTNRYGSQAEKVWANGNVGTKSVYVGVIDEGIQVAHPDLNANKWVNPYDPVDGKDNDGNGYVDDTNGWDFYSNNSTVYDGGTNGSVDQHGTHVAGTIGAKGGNGTGVAGVNWNVTLISAKFLGPTGGSTTGAVKAVNYLTDLKLRRGVNIVAINASWGGGGYSQALHDAIIRAAKANILFVAAAGNDGYNNDSTYNYPCNYDTRQGTSTQSAASYDAVISVAAIDKYGAIASWSNFGAKTVDLGAPGVSIYSTLPYNAYGGYSGTSMATPHVTGAAALYASTHPSATAQDIKAAILNSTTPTSSLTGKTVTGGRLNVSGF
jgi:subtilisin family serine protease